MVTVKIPRKYEMNSWHLTKNIKSLCQVYYRWEMPPVLATDDETVGNRKSTVKDYKGQTIRLIMYGL